MALKQEEIKAIAEELKGMFATAAVNGNAGAAAPAQGSMFAAPGAGGGFGAQPAPVAATTLPAPDAVLIPMQYNYADKATLSLYLAFPGSLVKNLEELTALCEGVRAIPGVRIWKPENKNGAGFRSRY